VSRGTERSDRVLFGSDFLDDDVVHFVILDFGSQVNVNFDAVLSVLFFDSSQERVEPFGSTKVTDDPREVDLKESENTSVNAG